MKIAARNIGEDFGSPFGTSAAVGGKTLGDLISLVLTISITVAGVLTLFLILFGGFYIISGAGQDNPERAAKGRQAATWGAIGFGVIFSAFWIIQLIETLTGTEFLTNPLIFR